MEQITIQGKTFNAPLRYEEGHELTAGEAAALNQTYHENLRNNFAKRVKDAEENGIYHQEAMQAEFDKYAEDYAFGVRSGGGGRRTGTGDPVIDEFIKIVVGRIDAQMKKKGVPVRSVKMVDKVAKAKTLIDSRPDIMDLARQRVAEAQAAASDDLDDFISDLKAEAAE